MIPPLYLDGGRKSVWISERAQIKPSARINIISGKRDNVFYLTSQMKPHYTPKMVKYASLSVWPVQSAQNNAAFPFVSLSSLLLLSLSFPPIAPLSLVHTTPAHKRHLHPWPRCEKLVHPGVELSQIGLRHKRMGKCPLSYIHVCVCPSVCVCVCVRLWKTLGVSWIGEIWPSTAWPVHTKRAF